MKGYGKCAGRVRDTKGRCQEKEVVEYAERRSRGKPECHKRVAEQSGAVSFDREQYAQVQEKVRSVGRKTKGGSPDVWVV